MLTSRFPLFLFLWLITFSLAGQKPFQAENGVLDARSFNIKSDKLALNGQWLFFDQQLLSPEEIKGVSGTGLTTYFPAVWNTDRNTKNGEGYATYCLNILLEKESRSLALTVPQMYNSYKIWVNQELVAVNGTVGKSKEETIPQWLPQTVSFENQGDTLQVVIQIANFHHNKGGSKDPIYLGLAENMVQQRTYMTVATYMEAIILFILAVTYLIIYFSKGRKKVVMYFMLLCLTWSVRAMFSNSYLAIHHFPDFNWEIMVKIEYFTLYLTMIWAILFLGRLFVNENSKIIKYLLVTGNIIFIALTLFTSAATYTKWLPAYLALSIVLIVYGIVVVVLALINDRSGVMSVVGSVLMALFVFAYDLFAYEGIVGYNAILLSTGYAIIFLLCGLALLYHLKILKSSSHTDTVLTMDDFFKESSTIK